jgi:hypothetical protein
MGSTAVDKAKETALISSINRNARLAKWNAYIEFAVNKCLGLGLSITGALGLVVPNILPLHLQPSQSEAALGIGLAMLAGHRVITLFAKVTNALKQ